jgi:flagellar protein FlaG
MDIQGSKPVSAVSTSAPGPYDRATATASDTVSPVAVKPIVAAQAEAPVRHDPQQMAAAIAEQLQAYLAAAHRDGVEFSVDADTGASVISVRDSSTGKVVRQMPNDEALQFLRHLHEGSGTLLNLIA